MPSRRAVRQAVSPAGTSVAVEARGDVFIAPTDSGGRARNLTNTPALAERTVSWSADGSRVAYLSEASGEYQLIVRAADGSGQPRAITVGERPGIFSDFKWSPDGRHIAYRDDRLSMWMLDLETGRSTVAGREAMGTGGPRPADWSPDGKWLVYTRQMPNHMGAAFLYSVESGRSVQATDGRADVSDPVFDASGQYLYFLASANRPMSTSATMAAFDHPVTISAYALLLASSGMPPTATVAVGGATRVDTTGLRSRVIRLPAPARAYQSLHTGAPGVVYLVDGNPIGGGPTQVAACRDRSGGSAGRTKESTRFFEMRMGSSSSERVDRARANARKIHLRRRRRSSPSAERRCSGDAGRTTADDPLAASDDRRSR
jgi:tricorn protease